MRVALLLIVAAAALLPLAAMPAPAAAQDSCYTGVHSQPVSCVGGALSHDDQVDGCRQIVCQNGSSSLTAKACDKEGGPTAHAELYEVFEAGSGIDACIGGTCLGDSGFARGDDAPLCATSGKDDASQESQDPALDAVNDDNTTGIIPLAMETVARSGVAHASLGIDPLFPQGPNYVFACNVTEFLPTQYTWSFGDGTTATRNGTRQEPFLGLANSTVINNNVFHTYTANGTYEGTCNATDGTRTASARITVNPRTPLVVDPTSPYGVIVQATPAGSMGVDLQCAGVGFPADVAWHVTNETATILDTGPYGSPEQGNTTVQLPMPGAYTATCSARTYEDRFRKDYYEPYFVPSSSSFGTISLDKTITFTTAGANGTGNGTTPGGNVACGVAAQAPSCVNGSLASTLRESGCWEFTCLQGEYGTLVKACDKPGSTNPQYFELYRISTVGPRLEFCLGNTCLRGNDFARSVCANQTGNGTNATHASASLLIAPSYPKGADYVFRCTATGFAPAAYDFVYGDGSSLAGLPFNSTYHRYAENGTYNVTCVAKSGLVSRSSTITVDVSTAGVPLNSTDATNATNMTNTTNQTCFSSVEGIPAACTGGTIIQDDFNRRGDSCRYITCSDADASALYVQACGKNSTFEMYKQDQKGNASLRLCLGATCISDNGFASGALPYCTGR